MARWLRRSVIISRYPVHRSQKWLDGTSLTAFGYHGTYTRDLFEAEIGGAGFDTPVHLVTTHLKSGSELNSATRRGAETGAGAICNFFVNVFRPQHSDRPYALTGDFNEDVGRPGSNSRDAVARLANEFTGLRLTRPTNPVTGSERTWPSGGDFLFVRYDYILLSDSLYGRIFRSEVFRASQQTPPPAPIEPGDEALASDHLPVLMIFRNPMSGPIVTTLRVVAGNPLPVRELAWLAWPRYTYQVLRSADLQRWFVETTFSPAGGNEATWPVEGQAAGQFFRVRRIP
jgi:endonuclease/exonuclease/phosphatase family metal-dependent hydrolase